MIGWNKNHRTMSPEVKRNQDICMRARHGRRALGRKTLDGRHRDGDTTLKDRTRKTEGRGTRAEAELDAALHYRSDRSTAYAVPQQ
jgi:hypothetical protein